MKITMSFTGLEKVQKQLASLSGAQGREAFAKAINDTGYEVRRTMQAEMASVFNAPTPYILKSVYVKKADANTLSATIEPTYFGGKGIDPQQILRAQEAGGTRRDKRSEVALRRVGILPVGYQTAIPKTPFPGSSDGMGNIRGPFMVQLISYLQAFGEQGYKANMTDRAKLALRNGSKKQLKTMGPRLDRRYIVSYGKLRGGARVTKQGDFDGRASNLAPGIWAVLGRTGANVRPVLMFVRTPRYTPRLSMERVAQKADTENYLAKRLRFRIRQAAGV